ncbi:hypothetical protein [Stomatobaculum longum]|uniref:hypothetical protein n=1 Tax=Stomatobaculum longum TaxID=796942 RepID=UPI0028F05D05|nr:hypothetical protein [Stomatobaculum longum]
MNTAGQKKLCFIAFRLYVVSIVTAFCLSFVPMDPLLRIGLKVLLLFLALFFYALHAKNNENHAYLDPKTLRAAGGPRYAFYFLVTRILPAYYLLRLILILVFMKVETVYE